jgi:hypothetical protein
LASKRILILIFSIFFLNSCTSVPADWNYWYDNATKKNAREKRQNYHVITFSSYIGSPFLGSSKNSYNLAESASMRYCRSRANDCYVYRRMYVSYNPDTGLYSYSPKTRETSKKKKATNTNKKDKVKKKVVKKNTDDEFDKLIKDLFGSRELDPIEGVYLTKKKPKEGKKEKIYAIYKKSEKYEHLVIDHPNEQLIGNIISYLDSEIRLNLFSAKILFKKKYEKKGTFNIINDQQDLIIKVNKGCMSNNKEICWKDEEYNHVKVWPITGNDYSKVNNLTSDQQKKIKNYIKNKKIN